MNKQPAGYGQTGSFSGGQYYPPSNSPYAMSMPGVNPNINSNQMMNHGMLNNPHNPFGTL